MMPTKENLKLPQKLFLIDRNPSLNEISCDKQITGDNFVCENPILSKDTSHIKNLRHQHSKNCFGKTFRNRMIKFL